MTLMDGSFNKWVEKTLGPDAHVDDDDNRNDDDFYDGANSYILILWEYVMMIKCGNVTVMMMMVPSSGTTLEIHPICGLHLCNFSSGR